MLPVVATAGAASAAVMLAVRPSRAHCMDYKNSLDLAEHGWPANYPSNTVTLDRGDGAKVHIVATPFLSRGVATGEAEAVIKGAKPSTVILQLDESRAAALEDDHVIDQSGESKWDNYASWWFRNNLSNLQKFGFTFYADMKAAKATAEEVGATIVLGDRPIYLTYDRLNFFSGATLGLGANFGDYVSTLSAAEKAEIQEAFSKWDKPVMRHKMLSLQDIPKEHPGLVKSILGSSLYEKTVVQPAQAMVLAARKAQGDSIVVVTPGHAQLQEFVKQWGNPAIDEHALFAPASFTDKWGGYLLVGAVIGGGLGLARAGARLNRVFYSFGTLSKVQRPAVKKA